MVYGQVVNTFCGGAVKVVGSDIVVSGGIQFANDTMLTGTFFDAIYFR